MTLIADQAAFDTTFPVPGRIQQALSLDGKQAYIEEFVSARDEVEDAYYSEVDRHSTPAQRTRKFLSALVNPAIGRPVEDAEQFYETFGRLMRRAWLSISVGIYTGPIASLPDAALRLHTAQTNTVDLAWQAALARAPKKGLLVEVGTGRGNSVVRLARLLPGVRIVSITISPEQARIVQALAEKLKLRNVEIRQGDIFDPATHTDLLGKADAVTAIEVTGHFPHERKGAGVAIFASLLKRGGTLSIMDTSVDHPLPKAMRSYYENQSWYFGTRRGYLEAFERAGAPPAAYIDHSRDVLQTFPDTTEVLRAHRAGLRREFGPVMALAWPELPRTVYLRAVQQSNYNHIVGIKH